MVHSFQPAIGWLGFTFERIYVAAKGGSDVSKG
jgi:hypothetical protein